MGNKWIVYPKKTNNIIEQLLINRNISEKNWKTFLNPIFDKDLLDPFQINGMSKVIKRIEKAIEKKEKIGIFTDYDADGIPGAALLYKAMQYFNLVVDAYIPSREEGYGLNEKGIKELAKNNCKILITIDLGITGKKEVTLAKKLGMDVIITDHHEIQQSFLPNNADIILHTHLSEKYKNKDLCGCGLVYKIIQALNIKLGKPTVGQMKWLLDLAAISTICDMVPLTGENRIIVKYGLIVLSKTKNLGLRKLYKITKINEREMNSSTVGFVIGPRINAPGRMNHAQASFYLLTVVDEKQAIQIAQKLNDINLKRQQTLKEILKKAENIIKNEHLDKEKIIVLKGDKWSPGIIGLVSSKITEKYNRPSIVFSKEGEKLKGSARSIGCFHLVKNLKKLEKYLLGFGGHAKAAGLTVDVKKYKLFYKKICLLAKNKISDDDLIKKIKIDALLKPKDLTFNLIKDLKKLQPHGLGNCKPLFLLKNMLIQQLRWVGKDKKHLKLKLTNNDNIKTFDAISFNCQNSLKNLKKGDTMDIVFYLDENIWQGRHRIDLKIVDVKLLSK